MILTALAGAAVPSLVLTQSSAQDDGGKKHQELPSELKSLRKEFEKLKKQWMVERKQYAMYSQIERYWDGPIGKQIIAMGPCVLPLFVKELRRGNFFFNYPMQVVAGFLLGGPDLDSEQARSKLWIKWHDELSRLELD